MSQNKLAKLFKVGPQQSAAHYVNWLYNEKSHQPIRAKLKLTPSSGDKWRVTNPITRKKYLSPSSKTDWTTAELQAGIATVIPSEDVKFITITPR